jgi:hypothetical protein
MPASEPRSGTFIGAPPLFWLVDKEHVLSVFSMAFSLLRNEKALPIHRREAARRAC